MNFTAKKICPESSGKQFTVKIFSIIFLIICNILAVSFLLAQDVPLETISSNNESSGYETYYPDALDLQLKESVESGNESEINRIQSEINRRIGNENLIITKPESDVRFEKDPGNTVSGDWMISDKTLHSGQIKSLPAYNKQIDLKFGEDSLLYAAVNEKEGTTYSGKVSFYNSGDNGSHWNYIGSIYSSLNSYITNISMLVESRSNSVKDSTRIILFYTKANSNNNNLSSLSFVSFRVSGSAFTSGQILTSGLDQEISHISAVSDGAYYSNATYLGVVCTISNSDYNTVHNIKILRTQNWGANWSSATLNTGQNDFYPSADFFKGSPSQIFIAVERRTGGSKLPVLLKTSWTPSSSFTEMQVSTWAGEKPYLTIRKSMNPDSMMITAIGNGKAYYISSGNSGVNWTTFDLNPGSGSNYENTYCYSSVSGLPAFTAIFSTSDGDSINLRRGKIAVMGDVIYKINKNDFNPDVIPVCALSYGDEINLPSILYVSDLSDKLYYNQESLKSLFVKIAIQGLYNSAADKLNMKDSLTVLLRRSTAPYDIIETYKRTIDSVTLYCVCGLNSININQSYYIVLKHRNSIETWSKTPVVINQDLFFYDFTLYQSNAYGNNLVKVDSYPYSQYGMYTGDVNQDGVVDATDGGLIDNDVSEFETGYIVTDLTGDNVTDASDAAIADNNAASFVSKITP